jgi:hypothetical protein
MSKLLFIETEGLITSGRHILATSLPFSNYTKPIQLSDDEFSQCLDMTSELNRSFMDKFKCVCGGGAQMFHIPRQLVTAKI